MEARKFKIGDKVFDIRYGWGRVLLDEFTEDYTNYSICVIFNKGKVCTYTKDGKNSITDINPILSHTEYSTQSDLRIHS